MLGRSKGNEANYGRDSSSVQQVPRSATASSAPPEVSSISSGLSIFGKIVDHGSLTIFGHVEGELHASAVEIAEGVASLSLGVVTSANVANSSRGTFLCNCHPPFVPH
jgi:hypothetical protein